MTSIEKRFEALFDANYGDVLAYAVRRCPTRQDAEDLAADTFSVAWRRMEDVPQGEAARLWLFGAAQRVRLNQARARRRERSLAERVGLLLHIPKDHGDDAPSPELELIGRALGTLKAADRELLQLHAWEELSADEIAVVLNISTPAVWKRLQRARERFAAALEQPAGEDPGPARLVIQPLREETP